MKKINYSNFKKTSDFDYNLSEELIAQTPIMSRDMSKLLVLNKKNGDIHHKIFKDIVDYMSPNDCIIFNNSKVLPARIFGKKENESTTEFLLLNQVRDGYWEALAKPGKKAKKGHSFDFGENLKAEISEILENGNRILKFNTFHNFFEKLDKIGKMPLPHYIKKKLDDSSRYQTVYAKDLGSAAAPTAGLHFTEKLIKKINEKKIKIGFITLHVGLGTFRPVKTEDISDHKMHSEFYNIPEVTANLINTTKKNGGRIFCVGTTSCRALEATTKKFGKILPHSGSTDIFITPGFEFKTVDAMITNFHLSKSTLIMLVCAFAGYNNIFKAYKEAIEKKYRFFSFGDAMLIK